MLDPCLSLQHDVARRRASLRPILPVRGSSPEPRPAAHRCQRRCHTPNAVAPGCGPRSIVCQQSRSRSRSRHAASAPAAAAAAAVAATLLLLLCNCCLLIPSAVFLGAPSSLNCHCADTSFTMHTTQDFSSSLPLRSFVTPFVISTHLHDSSDWTPRINVSI